MFNGRRYSFQPKQDELGVLAYIPSLPLRFFVSLAGNLSRAEAKGLLVSARVGEFEAVPLVFAWTNKSLAKLFLNSIFMAVYAKS